MTKVTFCPIAHNRNTSKMQTVRAEKSGYDGHNRRFWMTG